MINKTKNKTNVIATSTSCKPNLVKNRQDALVWSPRCHREPLDPSDFHNFLIQNRFCDGPSVFDYRLPLGTQRFG